MLSRAGKDRTEQSLWNKLFSCCRVSFVTFSCCVTIVVPYLVCINTDSFGVIICYNLVTGNTLTKIFSPCFFEMKIRASWGNDLNSKSITLEPIWLKFGQLSDSFSKKPCLRILISFFVFELEYFFTGNDLPTLTSAAYNKRTNAPGKNLRHGFLFKRIKKRMGS